MRISSILRIFCGAALAAACCVPLAAQQPAYYSSICLKVKPGRAADFASQISGNLLKVEQARLDLGEITTWAALRTVLPRGKAAQCDYMVVTFYPKLPELGLSDADLTAALQKAGLDMTPDQFWQPLNADVYVVSNDVGVVPVMIGSGKKGDYSVMNAMDMPDTSECMATQEKLWQPFAQARINAGQQSGWGIYRVIYPRGSKVRNSAGTFDIYPTWEAIFQQGFMKTWQQVNPNVTVGDATAIFDKQCLIKMAVIYKEVEGVSEASK